MSEKKKLKALKSHSANKQEIKKDLLNNVECIVHTRTDQHISYMDFKRNGSKSTTAAI